MNYISMSSSEDVIEHYGLKGMRLGIKSRSEASQYKASQYMN